jgi:hypothetical protein
MRDRWRALVVATLCAVFCAPLIALAQDAKPGKIARIGRLSPRLGSRVEQAFAAMARERAGALPSSVLARADQVVQCNDLSLARIRSPRPVSAP